MTTISLAKIRSRTGITAPLLFLLLVLLAIGMMPIRSPANEAPASAAICENAVANGAICHRF